MSTPISLTTTEDIDGEVRLNPTWAELDGVSRVDLLQDWIGVLGQLLQLAHHDLWKQGHEYRPICIDAISGWQHHGKWPEDYRSAVVPIRLARGDA
jgi:hypothetical protein